jgi:TolB-like protein/DNA-binding SARP family transcriptional activator/Flp pilus assembly protein TadD
MFTLRLLGGAAIESPVGPVTGRVAQRQRLALLALLGASRVGDLGREKLIAHLWPESDTEQGRHLLSNSIYVVRQALGDDAIIGAGDALRLNPERVRCDVREFDEAIAAGELERATDLYAGPFLDGFFLTDTPSFERWAEDERIRLGRAYGDALEALAQGREAAGDTRGAVAWWRKRAAHTPYDSGVAIQLMRALVAIGDRAGAVQYARVHAALVQGELGAEPHPEVTEYADRLRTEPPPPLVGGETVANARATTSGNSEMLAGTEAEPALPDRASASPRHGLRRRIGPVAALVAAAVVALVALIASGVVRRGEGASIRRIAVLPLANLSGDTAQEYFADAMTEVLITELARVDEARVTSRTSVMQYKDVRKPLPEIARALNVDAVVEGSVMRVGDRVRVTAQLIRAANDEHLWADSYDRDVRDVLALQDEIARAIAKRIGLELQPRPPTWAARARAVDPRAQDLYLRGLYLAGSSLRASIEAYRQSVAIAPDYAPAWAAMARSYYFLGFFGVLPPAQAFGEMRAAATKAVQYDATSADAYGTLALHELHWTGNFKEAERLFRRALELNGNNANLRHDLSHFLLAMNRGAESVAESRRSMELDPFNPGIAACAGWHRLADRRWRETVDEATRAAMIEDGFFWPHMILGWAFMQQGNTRDAVARMRRADSLAGGLPFTRAALGHALSVAGQQSEARSILSQLHATATKRYVSPYDVATIHVGLGERVEALRWLRKAQAEHASFILHAGWDPRLDPLRGDVQFATLLAEIGLPSRVAAGAEQGGEHDAGGSRPTRQRE